MTRLALLLAILACCPLQNVRAQDTLALGPGQRVRVTAPELGMEGQEETFQELLGDTLVFSSTRCRLSEVTRLEAYHESSPWPVFGLIGLVAGLALDITPWADLPDGLAELSNRVLGGAAGFLVGSLIGSRIKVGVWRDVPLPPVQSTVTVLPDGRFGFGFSVPLRR